MSGRMFMLAPGVYKFGKTPRAAGDAKLVAVPGDRFMSKEHASITVGASEIALEDPGSTNGSFVNGEKVSRAVLKSGDELRFGESIFRITFVSS
jgi:pSer/pThr/pTyr-binding forkhead associated (FHA) protein